MAADWRGTSRNRFPQLQIWRRRSGDTYDRIANTALTATAESPNQLYSGTIDPPLQFQSGDVLGMHIPRNEDVNGGTRLLVWFGNEAGSTYEFRTTNAPLSTITIGVDTDNHRPLLALEISECLSQHSSGIVTPPLSGVMTAPTVTSSTVQMQPSRSSPMFQPSSASFVLQPSSSSSSSSTLRLPSLSSLPSSVPPSPFTASEPLATTTVVLTATEDTPTVDTTTDDATATSVPQSNTTIFAVVAVIVVLVVIAVAVMCILATVFCWRNRKQKVKYAVGVSHPSGNERVLDNVIYESGGALLAWHFMLAKD